MSDAAFFLVFLLLPIAYALCWIVQDGVRAMPLLSLVALAMLAGMLVLIVWMVAELRSGGAPY